MRLRQLINNSRTLWAAQKSISNKRGVALMVAITCIMIIMWIAMEVSYDSSVEYLVNAQNLNRTKAYYAAKSGIKLSLLRVKIYEQAKAKLGKNLEDTSMLDQIWKFPFAWPLPIPDELNAVDKSSFQDAVKDSLMDASYFITIEDQGSKIDLTNLASPSEKLVEQTKEQLLNIFKQKINSDDQFSRKYGQTNFEELINRIADFQSSKNMSVNGGDKRSAFSDLNEDGVAYYPPNRSLRTVGELKLIPGMNEDFFDILETSVNVAGPKGINPNLATAEVLLGLDPGMTKEIVADLIKRRDDENEGGPFKCDKEGGSTDFWSYAQSKGLRQEGDPSKIPLVCDSPMSFKIIASGEFAGATREITVVTVQKSELVKKFKDATKPQNSGGGNGKSEEDTDPGDPSKTGGSTPPTQETEISKGPPQIIQWLEK